MISLICSSLINFGMTVQKMTCRIWHISLLHNKMYSEQWTIQNCSISNTLSSYSNICLSHFNIKHPTNTIKANWTRREIWLFKFRLLKLSAISVGLDANMPSWLIHLMHHKHNGSIVSFFLFVSKIADNKLFRFFLQYCNCHDLRCTHWKKTEETRIDKHVRGICLVLTV